MSQTVQGGLRALAEALAANPDSDATREARLLMAHALALDVSRMTLHLQDPLSEENLAKAQAFAQQRLARIPMSHILGARQFYGRSFQVDARVLDPRPETECLVAAALREPFESLLDLGTGSGAIALSLLAEQPNAKGIASDASSEALEVARANAQSLGVSDRCTFLQSDWFENITGCFDLIVSNPPYIALDEMDGLAPELAHEPRMALTDEADGLSAYRTICAQAGRHLNTGGRLLVEIGPTQGASLIELVHSAGLSDAQILPDLDGRDRVVLARKTA